MPPPCPAPQSFQIWYEQGLQATPTDTAPLSGVTATCGAAARLDVFPGTAATPDSNQAYPNGVSEVSAQYGTYLDNFQGVGGTGPVVVRACARAAATPTPHPARPQGLWQRPPATAPASVPPRLLG